MEDEHPGFLQVAVEKLAIGLVALLVIYVLSVGPVARWAYYKHDLRYGSYVDSFYAPVLWVGGQAKPIRSTLVWYVNLWNPDALLR